MAHFADARWNNPSGLVAAGTGSTSLAGTTATVNGVANVETVGATGVESGTPATFTNSATPATVVTFAVPRAGCYRISAYLKTTAAGTGSGQVCKMQETHNDGTAQAASDVTATGVDGTTANAFIQASKVVQCAAGTNIVLTVVGSGTITTAATIQPFFAIEAL